MSEFLFKKTLIIGLGLIGGSFLKSLRKNKLSQEIYAYDINEDSIAKAREQGLINDFFALENDVSGFDFIVIAAPLSSYSDIFSQIKKNVSKKTIIIDLGSLKHFVKEILPNELKENFVGCHPIAGLETSGFDASDEKLFENKKFIISDKNNNSKIIENLAIKIGAIPEFIEAKAHDEIYALVSHLPQFISFLSKEFLEKDMVDDFFKTAFRLDKSSPEIWEDIFKLNAKNLEKFYLEFFDNLIDFIEELPSFKANEIKGSCDFDEKFLEENFAPIFFRLLMVLSYLKIKKINDYKAFSGNGFKDFVSITKILCYNKEKLAILIKNNEKKIIKIFESIS